jgi:hypothetical protein
MNSNALIVKYKNELSSIDMCKYDGLQICYSTEHLIFLTDLGYIPRDLMEWELKKLEEIESRRKKMKEIKLDNPSIKTEDLFQNLYTQEELSPEQMVCLYEDAVKGAQLLELLYENKELLDEETINDLPNKFFESLESGEFGISRLVCDPLNQVPNLLKNPTSPTHIQEDIYLLKWECKNSTGDDIRLEYRYRAKNQAEADKQAQAFIKRLTGRQKKVFEACWAMANQKMRRTYTCNLTELMVIAYPARMGRSYFSTKEKVEFYQDLLDLSDTKFYVTKKYKSKPKKIKNDTFLLPLICVFKYSDMEGDKESDKYPSQISLSVLHNPLYESETMYHVGASIKYSTLELNSDDMQLAEWIQVRKNQEMKEKFISLDREFLIKLANLERTDQKHKGMANKQLLDKLRRLKDKGIILGHPQKIASKTKNHLKVR